MNYIEHRNDFIKIIDKKIAELNNNKSIENVINCVVDGGPMNDIEFVYRRAFDALFRWRDRLEKMNAKN